MARMALVAAVVAGLQLAVPVRAEPGTTSAAVVKILSEASPPDAAGNQVVSLVLLINDGWHLYANPVSNADLAAAGVETTVTAGPANAPLPITVQYPPGKLVKDETLGEYRSYEETVTIRGVVKRAAGDAGPVELHLKIQACNDQEMKCLPPATITVTPR
jgi:DsbC/DsbD-like thiol-disulfide interchange protein